MAMTLENVTTGPSRHKQVRRGLSGTCAKLTTLGIAARVELEEFAEDGAGQTADRIAAQVNKNGGLCQDYQPKTSH